MVRKVTLNRSEVELAKHFGVSLEEAAKAKLPKRGRPKGSKNKVVVLNDKDNRSEVSNFSETLKEWDRMEAEVDLKDLCEKLQEALAKSYVEAEELERMIAYWRNEVAARDIVIRYLEGRKA